MHIGIKRFGDAGVAVLFSMGLLFSTAQRIDARQEIIHVGREKNTCRFCHGKQGGEFKAGVHSKFDVKCVSCHGGDGTATEKAAAMDRAKGFKGKIPPKDIPALCDKCHGDYMQMRQFGIGTDQLAQYKMSNHGQKLFETGDKNVAQCVSCHGAHNVRRVSDPKSSVYPRNVPATCAKCHADKALMSKYGVSTKEVADYNAGVHGMALVKKGDLKAPSCASCHGNHGAVPLGLDEVVNVCGRCHTTERDIFVQSKHLENDVRCVDCHSDHKITADNYDIFTSSKKGGCISCHKDEKSKAGVFVRRIMELQTVSRMKLKDTKKDIRKAKGDGMDVRRLEASYRAALGGMDRFAVMQHQLSLRVAEDVLDREVNSRAEIIQSDVESFYSDRLNRKIIIGIVAVILMMFGVIVIAWRKMKRPR